MADDELPQEVWDAIGDRIDLEVAAQLRSADPGADMSNTLQLTALGIFVGVLWAESGRSVSQLDGVEALLQEKVGEDKRYEAVHVLSGLIARTAKRAKARKEGLPPPDGQ